MDLNSLLIWIIGFWCILLLIWLTRIPFNQLRGWVIVTLFILAVTGGIFYLNPNVAGLIGGSLWIILILLPLNGMKKASQLISVGRYGEASKLMKRLRWLHPADGWLEQPELLRALEMGQRGNMADAMKILNRYQTNATPIGLSATVLLYRMGSRWEELLLWIRNNLPEKVLFKDSTVVSYYLRALGETGDLNGLLHEFDRFESFLEKAGDGAGVNTVRMFILAFCGQPEHLQKLLSGPLAAIFTQNISEFWLGTAEMAAGNQNVGRDRLLALSDRGDIGLDNAIALRLSQPPIAPEQVLTESSRKILARVANELKQEGQYGRSVILSGNKFYATYALLLINFLVFALEIRSGGSENLNNLYNLGALSPKAVWAGEWWRLLSATFLHFGFLHLAMNMMALYALGSFVEASLGIWRYMISYLISGMGSMLTIAVLSRLVDVQDQLVVGASGAIMGLIGVMAAIMLRGWRKDKSRVAAKGLRSILLIIGLQVIFDLVTPQVSMLGHNSGLIIGFLIGNLLLINWQSKK
ncbi:rhomboid family intramembrane serine protease [Argonema antarcticum]|uniref:rhomboid family intramembrane serine protease n=1 Tax=Argonema antarcticum TaxID=2942763 RepID=UPI002012682B|nr:rhomboid family intramembrane serine protease [Argonema antarcticum]MCL1471158.1 rhomboid family intramembrane serine protease [Argonema antarcticum A004/B2]